MWLEKETWMLYAKGLKLSEYNKSNGAENSWLILLLLLLFQFIYFSKLIYFSK